MAENEFDIGIGTEVDIQTLTKALKNIEKQLNNSIKNQNQIVDKGNKNTSISFKSMANDISKSLTGIDFTKFVTSATAVTAAMAVLGKLNSALKECAELYRQQEKAEIALANAARNNPYLNDRNVKQLISFANEMQRLTGVDNVLSTQMATQLASLGRSQDQIQKIMTTAADWAATGMMSFDAAVMELNMSLNGMVRTSGRLYPELKNLSKEAMAAGEAIDIIAGKVAGSAAEAMKTGAGSVTAYKNAQDDLKKAIGEFWDWWGSGARNIATRVMNWYADGISGIASTAKYEKELKKAREFVNNINDQLSRAGAGAELHDREYLRLRDLMARANDDVERLSQILHNNRATMTSEEKARINEEIDAAEMLATSYREQARARVLATGAITEAERAALNEKLNLSDQYMMVLEDELRMIEVLIMMEDQQYKVMEHYSLAEKQRAEDFKKSMEEAGRALRDYNEEWWNRYTQREDALTAQERKARENEAEQRRIQAEKYRDENQAALDAEIEKIKRKAEYEGKSIDDLEVQNQILNANYNAYENLLSVAKDYLDNLNDIDKANFLGDRFELLKRQWVEYGKQAELEKFNDEQRQKRFQELVNKQKSAQSEINSILAGARAEAERQADLAGELEHQEKIRKIKESGAANAAEQIHKLEVERAEWLAERKTQLQQEKLEEQKKLALEHLAEIERQELEKVKDNAALKRAMQEMYKEQRLELIKEYDEAEVLLAENLKLELINIHNSMLEQMDQAEKESIQRRMAMAQELINSASQIASNISTIWQNEIGHWENEQLRANDAKIQSDEERAANEEKIMKEAAYKRYEAEMYAWAANVTSATAQAAMAALTAYAEGLKGGGKAATIIAAIQQALAAAAAGAQVGALISARPQRPRFHTGGMVQGSGDVPITAKGKEFVLTNAQFQNTMGAIASLANMRQGSSGINQKLIVNNTVSDQVSANVTYNPEEVIISIVNKGLSDGRLDQGLLGQESYKKGAGFVV